MKCGAWRVQVAVLGKIMLSGFSSHRLDHVCLVQVDNSDISKEIASKKLPDYLRKAEEDGMDSVVHNARQVQKA